MNLIVYADFNCPYSCLASARVDALVDRGVATVDWRAVEHDPTIPKPSRAVSGEVAEMLDRELLEIRGLLRGEEGFPIRRPPVHPNSAAAIEAFASAPPDAAPEARRRLFAALWSDGRDIGDRAVLAELFGDVTMKPTEQAARWNDAWCVLERRVVPTLVLPDGYVSRGLGALARLAELAWGTREHETGTR